jgi:hypothetical protein
MSRASLALVVVLFPALAVGQSLGDVARKERARREENRKQGAKVRVVAGEVDTDDDGPVSSTDTEADGASSASTEGVYEKDSSEERRKQELEWRGRVSEARDRVAAARENYEMLSNLHLTQGGYYVDENAQPVITSVEQLQGMVARAKAELDQATEAKRRLREEARRAGVPPGWLR